METLSYTQQQLLRAITKLFLGMNKKASAEQLRVYVEVLSGVPLRIVEEACDYAMKGKLSGAGKFMPTSGELYQLAQELLSREFRETKAERERRYCEVETKNSPAQRARIIAGFKQLFADLRSGKPIDPDEATREVFK